MLEVGTLAPDFTLPDQDGTAHRLSDYRGKKVILYFYPRDNTPGCTKQACGYSALVPELAAKNAVVLGVSKDSVSPTAALRTSRTCTSPCCPTRSVP